MKTIRLFRPTLHGDEYLRKGKIACMKFPDGDFDAHKEEMELALKIYQLRSFTLLCQDTPVVDNETLVLEGSYFIELCSNLQRAAVRVSRDCRHTLEGIFELDVRRDIVLPMTRGGRTEEFFGDYVVPFCVNLHESLRAFHVKNEDKEYARKVVRDAGYIVPVRSL